MTHICGILMPRKEPDIIRFNEELTPCLKASGHWDEHLMQTADDRFIVWSFEETYCGDESVCACLEEDGLIECFNYGEVSPKEAKEMIDASFTVG